MAFRFLHTADWHIGKPFHHVPGDAGFALRKQRIDTVAAIAVLAQREGVDAVLVAGDAFDGNDVSDKTIVQTLTALQPFEGTWVFPKGHIDPGEDALEAAVREVEEEAGVRAWCPDPAFQPTTRYENARGVPRVITWFCLLTESEKPTLREFLFPGGDFLEPAEASTRLSFDEDRRLLETVLAYRGEGVRP